jgi:predicted XRE-type DNA-binding protein
MEDCKMKNAYDYWLELSRTPDLQIEKAKTDFSSAIYQLMTEKNISRASLARAIHVSKPYISKILAGTENFTIKTMAALAFALGHELNISLRPIEKESGLTHELNCIFSNRSDGEMLSPAWSSQFETKGTKGEALKPVWTIDQTHHKQPIDSELISTQGEEETLTLEGKNTDSSMGSGVQSIAA